MSDLCSYQLEDIAWDEFCQSDDHIVPQPGAQQGVDNIFQVDNHKKPRREVIDVSSNTAEQLAAIYVKEENNEIHSPTVKKKKDLMLENDTWACMPDNVYHASCDGGSIKETKSSVSDHPRISSHCFKNSNLYSIGSELGADDPTIDDGCGAVDGDPYHYSLDHISQTDNNLSFFDNDREDKESSDLLYYGWPDIENFEDVDRMFRNCDSTFGLSGVGNEDELGWFSSSHTIEGSEDALKSDFKFSRMESSPSKNIQQYCEPLEMNNASYGSNIENSSVSYRYSSQTREEDDPSAVGQLTFVKGCNRILGKKDECIPKEQIHLHKKQAKHQNQYEGKRKGRCLEYGGSYHHINNPEFTGTKLSSEGSSPQVFLSQQMHNVEPDSFGYVHTQTPYMYSNYSNLSDQTSVSPTPSSIKSENNGLSSIPPKDSSYESYPIQSVISFHKRSIEVPVMPNEKRGKQLHFQQEFQPSFTINQKRNLAVQAASKSVSVPKQFYNAENKVENLNEAEAVTVGIPAELDSTNVQESSCTSSAPDGISLEATSFHQLQHVMEQLDIRTKLCIRDSLYRLARSAEQRHNHVNLIGGSRDGKDACGILMDEGTNSGFMDMETDTNPIDRSIAHLLFHRPSESSAPPAYDALSMKTHAIVHGSVTSPAGMTENQVLEGEAATEGR